MTTNDLFLSYVSKLILFLSYVSKLTITLIRPKPDLLLDEFTRYGVAATRGRNVTAETGMEGLRTVDFIQKEHDVTRYCDRRTWWQLKCGTENCIGKFQISCNLLPKSLSIASVSYTNEFLGCNSPVIECIHHQMRYMVGLVGLNVLYLLPWTDEEHKLIMLQLGGAEFLPENVDMTGMNLRTGSKSNNLKLKNNLYESYDP